MRKKKIIFLTIAVFLVSVIMPFTARSQDCNEREMARFLAKFAGEMKRESGLSVEYTTVNWLNEGQTYAYIGTRYDRNLYAWQAIPYTTESQDIDMYVYDAKSGDLIAKDNSSLPFATVVTTEPLPFTLKVRSVVKMEEGSGCYVYIVYTPE